MKRKTYGVPGTLEYLMLIPCGAAVAKVHFRGGSIQDRNRQPARFSTSRYLEQTIIENSNEFLTGKIILMSSIEVPDDAEEIARKAMMEPKPLNMAAGAPVVEEPKVEAAAEEQVSTADVVGEAIEVADKTEAVEWLKEHFPDKEYTGVKLRSKQAFDAACEECGVRFTFTQPE